MQTATAIWRNHKVSHAIEGESEGGEWQGGKDEIVSLGLNLKSEKYELQCQAQKKR